MNQNEKRIQYIASLLTLGSSGGGGGGTINGTIASTQVAFGTSADTIGGENDFVYDTTNNLLTTEKIRTQVVVDVRNETGSAIGAGSVVYVNGDGKLVSLADASDPTKMPSIGIVTNNLGDNQNGYAAISGQVNGLDGSAGNTIFDSTIVSADVGKILYVSPINAGRLTITKPTSLTHLIQNVGRILDLTGSNVRIVVSNIGRSNDVPNTIDAGELTVNSSYTFPSSDGTSGQTLVTNGSGALSFQTPIANQLTVDAVCDESVTSGDIVRYLQNGEGGTLGRVVNANASEEQSRDLYISLSTGSSGSTLSLLLGGSSTLNFSATVANTDIGKTVYLSTTDGKATLTPPSNTGDLVVQLGTVTNATGTSSATVLFRPQFIVEIG